MKQLFPYGKPVTGDDLIDREEIIGEIVRDVQGGQSLILASPRRYGKSSVVLESLARLSRMGLLTGYVDLFEKSSLSEFAEGIIETVLSNQTSRAKEILRMIKTNIGEFLRNIQFRHIWEDNEIVLSLGSKTQYQMALMD